jgi:hypothetical protein
LQVASGGFDEVDDERVQRGNERWSLPLICRLLTIGVAVAAETLAFRTKVSMLMMIVNGGRHVPHVEWLPSLYLAKMIVQQCCIM